jgi:arylsulfatase A-like enzyme
MKLLGRSVVFYKKNWKLFLYFFQAGTVSSALTSSLDILPTLAMLAGVKLPVDRYFDGVDMTSVITGSAHSIRQVRHSGVPKSSVLVEAVCM